MKRRGVRSAIAGVLIFALSACMSTTTHRGPSGYQIRVNENAPIPLDSGIEQKYSTTSFGQYKFKITKDGEPVMHGLMPLKMNFGYMVMDILFFAPAMFFNLRESFRFYEYSPEEGVLRYRQKADDPWIEYRPNADEIYHSKTFYGDQ